MAVVRVNDKRSISPTRYLMVDCSCGRTLRAAPSRIGATVRCWDCRQQVSVPVPRHPARAARVLSGGLREAFEFRSLLGVFLGAAAFTGSLFLPVPEPLVVAVLAALAVLGYGEIVRRRGLASLPGFGPGPGRSARRGTAARVAATLAVGLLLTNLWVLARGWLAPAPALFNRGLAVGAVLAVVVPLAMLIVWAAADPRQALKAVALHPFSTLAALAVVPLGLVAAEAIAVAITSYHGMFSFYVIDLFPGAEAIAPKFGVQMVGFYGFPVEPEPGIVALYRHFLARGVTLSMALPASFGSIETQYSRAWGLVMFPREYAGYRAFHTFVLAFTWLLALTIQARCLCRVAWLAGWYLPGQWGAAGPVALEDEVPAEASVPSAPLGLGAGGPRVVGPGVPGVAGAEVLADLEVGR
jgi:hypothetical protein